MVRHQVSNTGAQIFGSHQHPPSFGDALGASCAALTVGVLPISASLVMFAIAASKDALVATDSGIACLVPRALKARPIIGRRTP